MKIQDLPEKKKKMIFFVTVGIAALIMIVFAVVLTKKNIAIISESLGQVKLPALDIEEREFPGTNIQTEDWENLKNSMEGVNSSNASGENNEAFQ